MQSRLFVVFALVLVLGGLGLVVWNKSQSGGEVADKAGGPTGIVVSPVLPAKFSDRIEALGTAVARESVDITARVTDTVSRVNFQDGQQVEAGEILIELTDAEEAAQLADARARLAEADKQFRRISDLVSRGNASEANLDTVRAERDRSRAQVNAIEAQLADRIIKAPFAGVLGLRQVSLGGLLEPGDVVTTLDDVSIIKVDFSIPETFLSALSVGLQIEAESAAFPEETFRGTVTTIDARVDPATRQLRVRAEIPNSDGRVRPGMLLAIEVESRPRMALAISENAIVPVGGDAFVFLLAKGEGDPPPDIVKRTLITTGSRREGLVEVKSGLREGDRVVVEGVVKVRPNDKVKVIEERIPQGTEAALTLPSDRPGAPAPVKVQ